MPALRQDFKAYFKDPSRRPWQVLLLYELLPAPVGLALILGPSIVPLLLSVSVDSNILSFLALAFLLAGTQSLVYALLMSLARSKNIGLWRRFGLSALLGLLSGLVLDLTPGIGGTDGFSLYGLMTGLIVEAIVSLYLLIASRLDAARNARSASLS